MPRPLLGNALLLALAAIKGRRIALDFIDLRAAPSLWRGLVERMDRHRRAVCLARLRRRCLDLSTRSLRPDKERAGPIGNKSQHRVSRHDSNGKDWQWLNA